MRLKLVRKSKNKIKTFEAGNFKNKKLNYNDLYFFYTTNTCSGVTERVRLV